MANYEGYNVIKIEKIPEKKIAVVTLNEPEYRNPISSKSSTEIADIFEEIEMDDEVNAVVLTGAGKCFSAGGDIREFNKVLEGKAPHFLLEYKGMRPFLNILDCRKPVIAAINGDAIGAGASIALCCDVTFMAEEARIADWHVRMGIVAGDGGCYYWPLYVGLNKAKELIMTGDPVTGAEAERLGLVNHAVPQEDVMPKAMEFAERLAGGPIQAISWIKTCMNKLAHQYIDMMAEVALARELLCFMYSEDHKEAVNAFKEKRKPKYKGHWISKGIGHRRHLPQIKE
jgi:enoyl-CoA hydratase/carnithine racemase